jgi:hypothetical protein
VLESVVEEIGNCEPSGQAEYELGRMMDSFHTEQGFYSLSV